MVKICEFSSGSDRDGAQTSLRLNHQGKAEPFLCPLFLSESFDYRVALDREYFNGKKVIIFDDVVTSGATAREFANELAECGAQVMGAMFLARTKRMYN